MNYIDGFVASVQSTKQEEYLAFVRSTMPIFKEYGALRLVEGWGDDVPDGTLTDFRKAVKAEDGEVILFSWVEWPSKEVRDAGMKKIFEDPRMQELKLPIDGKRMIFGGFRPIFDE